jgi:hypothetical protein
MVELYPPTEPYDHGLLDVGDGNPVYRESAVIRDAPRWPACPASRAPR